jgi:hypothetical protein
MKIKLTERTEKEIEVELPCYRRREHQIAKVCQRENGEVHAIQAWEAQSHIPFPTNVNTTTLFVDEYFDAKSTEATEQDWIKAMTACQVNIRVLIRQHNEQREAEV